jgi:signal transduction histidine kinase
VLGEQAAMLGEQLAQEQQLALRQRNFVSMASHEFRTPLTIIDGHARRLVKTKDRVGADEIGERAGKVRSAVLRMTNLIDGLLNSSRLVDGAAELHFKPAEIELAGVLHELCQLHRDMAPATLIVERLGGAPLPTTGDANLLFQAFSNLISNAVKYSPRGGAIEVGAETAADQIAVSITDRGIGIPAADLDRLFERDRRGSNVSGIVGTGVGLYLVKMVVDLHHGAIDIRSKEGEGSCFTIRLPRRAAARPVSAPPVTPSEWARHEARVDPAGGEPGRRPPARSA